MADRRRDSDYSHVKQISATAVAIVTADGSEIHFTANANKTGWVPEPGAEHLTLKGVTSGSFTLSATGGTVTEFTKPDADATTWQVSSTLLNGLSNSTITVVSEAVTVDGAKLARPRRIIAPTSAVSAATCAVTPTTKGCRVLEFVYATSTTAAIGSFGDYAGQVKEVMLYSAGKGASSATARAVATYRYDADGRLRQQWNPRLAQSTQTQYAYDTAGRVTSYRSSTDQPWTFTYGKAGSTAVADNGMLLKVSRPALKQGTTDTIEGTAATTIVYDVPLTGATAPHPMGDSDVMAWGQTVPPTDATAVFPPDATPASNAGSDLDSGSYSRAEVHYLSVSGREVNVASPGGHITTTQYDRFGNTVRELTAGNRAVALGLTTVDKAAQSDLGIAQLPGGERADLLATNTVYNETGTRELEKLGPLHRIDLTSDLKSGTTTLVSAGSSVIARSWTVNEYDGGRPTDGTAKIADQITKTTVGAQVREHPAVHGDTRVQQTIFDWSKGLPLKSIQDPNGLALVTAKEYDAQGRITKELLPGATGDDAATQVTTYWSATGTGTCSGRPEWADLVCTTGPAGAITGGGSNPAQLPTSAYEYDSWGNHTSVIETANGVSRTTSTTYDGAGQPTTTTVSGGTGQTVPTATIGYDSTTGRPITTSSPTAGTISKAYDTLGRQVSYTDADGGTTTAEYDLLNRPVNVKDSSPSTVTYTYDTAVEPRGLATTATDSVAGAFQATYDADGAPSTEELPGGYSLSVVKSPAGEVTERTYTRSSDGTLVYSDTVTTSVHGQAASHAGWSDQTYRYDAVGRLTTVLDTSESICTRRSYTFDARANRESLTAATNSPGENCPSSGGTTVASTFDSGDRLADGGHVYDAFGRTTALPGNGTISYYANDLVHQQVANGQRQTWQLDPDLRMRSWTTESGSGSTWTETASKLNHYGSDGDTPRWIVENTATGEITRNVDSLSGDLGAVTSKTGDTVLQLSSIHGDVALQLPLDTSQAPTALDSDEYGKPRSGQSTTRYNWLGSKQRSAETVTGLSLMGVRLYNPSTGRFLSPDPVYGGNANAYEYCVGDPVNCHDLSGTFRYSYWKNSWWSPILYLWVKIKFTRGETRTLAWGAGAAAGLLGIVKDYVPGMWKHVINGMRFYAWYISVSAGWIYYHTKSCATLQGGYARGRWSGRTWYVPPLVGRTRC